MSPRNFFRDVHPKWWVLLAVGVGSLMGSIDSSVVNIILPVVRGYFGCSVATVEWAVTIYLLLVCGLLLPFGRLGDMHGHKRLYILGFAIFTVASAACGLAWGVAPLIVARGVQAVGAAIMFACSSAVLTANFPASERGRALGLQVLMVYLGSMMGPLLGGWLTDHFSWRAVFYVNVPVGLAASVLCFRFIPRDDFRGRKEPFDFLGAILFMAVFVALLFGLNQGYDLGWTSLPILGLMTTAVILLLLFILLERRRAYPLLDLSLFRKTQFSMSVASGVLNYMACYSILFLMPFYLIQGRGITPGHAGMWLAIQPALMTVSAPISGVLSDRVGTRLPAGIGMAVLSAGAFMLATLGPESSMTRVGLALGVVGLGTGMFIAPNNSALMGAAPSHRLGMAAGVLATARFMGMILGIGIAGAIFTSYLTRHTSLALFQGIRASFLVASFISFAGCLTSFVRKEHFGDKTVPALALGKVVSPARQTRAK